MKQKPRMALVPKDTRAIIAVDLGAESCRLSLLRWHDGRAVITLVHRFANAPRQTPSGLRWDISMIEAGIDTGLRKCAFIATEGVRSIAVDGWAVDYVRLGLDGTALTDPFCYRDERTIDAERALYEVIPPDRLRELTGVQLLRINTLCQLYADALQHASHTRRWLNIPEYILSRLGGVPVAELTNASHTQLVALHDQTWSEEIFAAAGINLFTAPQIVSPGTTIGKLRGPLFELPAFRNTLLIAPACHDTASAIAGIPAQGDDWAYISSGTWSLVGTLLEQPLNGPAVRAENFTNLRGAGNQICFHKNVNGMWLIRQCISAWSEQGTDWSIQDLVTAAEKFPPPSALIDVDHPDLLLAGQMPERINAQVHRNGFEQLDTRAQNAPAFANLIFHSLAARYAEVLDRVAYHSGKRLKRLFIVGGASQNDFLNRLTQDATGLDIFRGSAESSTIGNFAIQMATLEAQDSSILGASASEVSRWASFLLNPDLLISYTR